MKQHNPHRISRINDLVHQQLMVILRRESNDPRLNKLNVTGVEVSRDLSVAKIFYTDDLASELININSDKKTNNKTNKTNKTNNKNSLLQKSLEKASGFLRRELARRCDLRKTPELRFIYDKSIDQGSKIEGILRSVKSSSSDAKSSSSSSSSSDSGSSEQD